jgi:hypothetical protein
MRKLLFFLLIACACYQAQSQKVQSITFNLYTDSLKKGFYNYINVDGKLSDGTWQPLDTSQIRFSASTGFFKGNDLFIDSSFSGDKILVRATLKSNPSTTKDTIIYIRKRGFDEPLKSGEEILEEMRTNNRKKKKERFA